MKVFLDAEEEYPVISVRSERRSNWDVETELTEAELLDFQRVEQEWYRWQEILKAQWRKR